jgi:hypothetical protein
MAKDPDHPKLRAGVKQTLEQAHLALDAYFEFLKKSVSSFPSGGTELGEKLKDQGVENINALQEVVKRLSQAESFEEALRIQTAFIHSQLNLLGKQATSLGEAYTAIKKDPDNREKALLSIKFRCAHRRSVSKRRTQGERGAWQSILPSFAELLGPIRRSHFQTGIRRKADFSVIGLSALPQSSERVGDFIVLALDCFRESRNTRSGCMSSVTAAPRSLGRP